MTTVARQQTMPLTGELVGLPEEPVEVTCPSCGTTGQSAVRKEVSNFSQRVAACVYNTVSCCGKINCCTSLSQKGDFNHYCDKCGCFLGRHHKRR